MPMKLREVPQQFIVNFLTSTIEFNSSILTLLRPCCIVIHLYSHTRSRIEKVKNDITSC